MLALLANTLVINNFIDNRKALWTILLLAGYLFSCEDKAVDGQQYDLSEISKSQGNMIYRESKDFPNNTQLAIALIENGAPRFYGIERRNDTILGVKNKDHVFEIGSISKVFTATLLADFVLNNKLALNDPVSDYLPFKFKDTASITFKQLSNHTSGLPRLPGNFNILSVDFENPYKDYGEEQLEEYLSLELELDPR